MFWLILSILVLAGSVIFAFWSIRKEIEMTKMLPRTKPEGNQDYHAAVQTEESAPVREEGSEHYKTLRIEEGPRRPLEARPQTGSSSDLPATASVSQPPSTTPDYQEASQIFSSKEEKKDQLRGQIDLRS